MRLTIALLLAALLTFAVRADDPPEYRAFYAATFDINTQAKCDAIIANALSRNINAIFVEVRARADAYYYPNREDALYPNTEPRGELYAISPSDLDVLQYFIDACHAATPRVEVHAWCTTFNSWNRVGAPSSGDHVFNAHPEWITEDSAGVTYTSSDDAPLDPGIPAVQDHIHGVFMDILRNYDIDGLHFDYIRLLGADSGYDPVALAQFAAETGWTYNPASPGALSEVYEAWRRDQISQLVQRVHADTNLTKPWVDVSAFLVNFSDSVEVLGQGYNWWVAHDAIDLLSPGCYSSSTAGTIDDWNFYIAKLSQNGNQNDVPMMAALGTYLMTEADHTGVITTLRGNARPVDGFNFFDYGALFVDGTPADEFADGLFDPTGPMDDWAPIPAVPHKADEETTPPNAPASVSGSLVSGVPRVSFNRPAAAADGDLPVHYRLYRDGDASVDLTYANMVMEWWDLDSTRTSFIFDDVEAAAGNQYYAVVVYDDWNNQAVANVGPLAATGGEIILESHTSAGAVTSAPTFSQSGGWYGPGSTAKSNAPGLTGSGSEFSSNASLDASFTFTPNIAAAGNYDVYITTPGSAASINAANSTYSITHQGGTATGTIALTQANTGDQWVLMESGLPFAVGTSGSITVSEGAPQGDRFYADAVRLVPSGATPKEALPVPSEPTSPVIEVIADSHPQALDYDDNGNVWSTSTLTGYYNANARFYSSGNTFPPTDYAVWVIDLPREGRWAIDGWVRDNSAFATGARYRFVDGNGVTRNVTTSQQTGTNSTTTGDWHINVDGVTDDNAYYFEKGRVYVTLWGNAAGAQTLIADALRFRLIDDVPVGITLFGAD